MQAIANDCLEKIPVSIPNTNGSHLRPFFPNQLAAFEKIKDRKRVALFMEMRLGKSLTILRWAKHHKLRYVLIVTPLSVIPSWENECFLERIPCLSLSSADKHLPQFVFVRNVVNNKKLPGLYVIANYEALLSTDLLSFKWHGLILDESTRIRNHGTQIADRLLSQDVFTRIRYRAILSGKPAPETLLGYFNQLKFLHTCFLGETNYFHFRRKYFERDHAWDKWHPKPGVNILISQELNRVAVQQTRKDFGVGSQKIYERRYVDFPAKIREAYNSIEKDWSVDQISTKWIIVAQNWLHQLCGGFPKQLPYESTHKLAELKDLLTGELKDEQVLIWANYRKEIDNIKQLCDKFTTCETLTGDTRVQDRGTITRDFKSGRITALIIQTATGKFGLDLSTASTSIYYSTGWSAENRYQSEERLIHPQKKEPVLIIDLVTKNSIDLDILDALKDKKISTELFNQSVFERFKKRLLQAS